MFFAGDLGTEARLATSRGRLVDLFGGWIDHDIAEQSHDAGEHEGAEQEHPDVDNDEDFDFEVAEDCFAAGNQPQAPKHQHQPRSATINLAKSLFIVGMLHIIHKGTEELNLVLFFFEEFVSNLSEVCKLLRRKWSRSRLLATCFCDLPHRLFQGDYLGFNSGVYQGRWGSIVEAVGALLALERSLRTAWSKERYLFGNGRDELPVQEGEGPLKTLSINKVNQAIESAFLGGVHEGH